MRCCSVYYAVGYGGYMRVGRVRVAVGFVTVYDGADLYGVVICIGGRCAMLLFVPFMLLLVCVVVSVYPSGSTHRKHRCARTLRCCSGHIPSVHRLRKLRMS